MARNIGPIVEILLKRVRQSGGLAVDVDKATEIYSLCEQLINLSTQRVTATITVQIPKEKLVFNYRNEIPDAIGIKTITENDREVFQCHSLNDFSAYEKDWFRSITGTRFEAWLTLGFDLLFLYPGQAAASSVDVEYIKLLTHHTDFQASYATASQLPDEDVDIAIGLAEVILLARFRLTPTIAGKLENLVKIFTKKGMMK